MMNDSKLEQKFCTNIITHALIPVSFPAYPAQSYCKIRKSGVARGCKPLDGARGYLSPREGALPGGQVILAPSLLPAAEGGKKRTLQQPWQPALK
jgi:hypothetical protein